MNNNKVDMVKFFDNLEDVMTRYYFVLQNIYNVDETGVITVQKPNKVFATKETKQVGAITFQEPGTLVTVCVAGNAIRKTMTSFYN